MARKKKDGRFSRAWEKHHSVPKSRKDDVRNYDVHGEHNIVIVPSNTHRNFHAFSSNLLPHELAQVLNSGWIDPRCELLACWKGEALDEWKQTVSGLLYR